MQTTRLASTLIHVAKKRKSSLPTAAILFVLICCLAGWVYQARPWEKVAGSGIPTTTPAATAPAGIRIASWNIRQLGARTSTDLLKVAGLISREQFDLVVEMLAGRYASQTQRELRARLAWDPVNNKVAALPGARLLALTNGGTITDRDKLFVQTPETFQATLNVDVRVNCIEYWEVGPTKVHHGSWVTDLRVSTRNVLHLMRGGRARWKIANETFNTLKNQGDHFEHN